MNDVFDTPRYGMGGSAWQAAADAAAAADVLKTKWRHRNVSVLRVIRYDRMRIDVRTRSSAALNHSVLYERII